MDYVALGKRIRMQRLYIGLTQEKLAEMAGVSTSFIGHVERGSRKASMETVVAIANAMDCSLDYLLCDSLDASWPNPDMRENNASRMSDFHEKVTEMKAWLDKWASEQ